MISLIAAYAQGRVIGCDGRIPWNIPEDKKRFRELTTGNVVVMGRRTYEEIGCPLPNRDTVLISSTVHVEEDHGITVRTLRDALEWAAGREVFICGGEQLYREALPLADRLYLTEVAADVAGDRYFPEFNAEEYFLTEEETVSGSVPCIFRTYERCPMLPEQAQNYVNAIAQESGIVLGLDPLKELLARLGNPQNRTRFLHIAGTNGKGSVGAMLRTVLSREGYRVGQYSSPAVFDPMEQWRINDRWITPEEYAGLMSRIQRQRDAMLREGRAVPTAFEIETALAFLYFSEHHCDMAILECGMGGRDDATNVIETTLVSLLTSIGLDHTRFLGGTIEEIAEAKGGIVRPEIPVVMQGQGREAEQVIHHICCANNSPFVRTKPEEITQVVGGWDGMTFQYAGTSWHTSLTGSWQVHNAVQVIETVKELNRLGIPVEENCVREGLMDVCWPGRMETIRTAPRVVLDGAHNPDAARRLRETLQMQCVGECGRLILVMGVLADKDYDEVVAQIVPLAQAVYTVTPTNSRALPAEQLADCVRKYTKSVRACTMDQAAEYALRDAGPDGTVLAMGSLSYLKEFRCCIEAVKE